MMRFLPKTFPNYAAYVAITALLVGSASIALAQQDAVVSRPPNAYPADVFPESGNRLPLPKREALDDLGKKQYDETVSPGTRSIAGLRGPVGIRLYSPKVSELTNALGNQIRYEGGMPADLRELIILSTAREMNNQFEWAAHEPIALRVGVSQRAVDVIKYRYSAIGLSEKQEAVIQLTREIFRNRKVQPDTFALALKTFGERDLVNIVALVGYYSATAILIDTFDMQLEPNQRPPLPMP